MEAGFTYIIELLRSEFLCQGHMCFSSGPTSEKSDRVCRLSFLKALSPGVKATRTGLDV